MYAMKNEGAKTVKSSPIPVKGESGNKRNSPVHLVALSVSESVGVEYPLAILPDILSEPGGEESYLNILLNYRKA